MRKFISLFAIVLSFVNFIFSFDLFSSRVFEMKAEAPMSVSNNLFSLNKLLVKDLVIDFAEIADDVSEKGFDTVFKINPSLSSKLNFDKVAVGSKIGTDIYLKISLAQDFFKFIGNGYKAGDTVNLSFKADMDICSYMDFPIDVKIGKFKFSLTPSIFLPLIYLEDVYTKGSFSNGDDGKLKAVLDTKYKVLVSSSLYDVDKDSKLDLYPFEEISKYKLLGFDLSGSFEFPIINKLNLIVAGHFPIIPGRLNQRINYTEAYTNYEASVMGLIGGSNQGSNNTSSGSLPSNQYEYVNYGENWVSTGHGLRMERLNSPFFVNRPLEFSVYAIYRPFNFLDVVAGGGIDIEHAFDSGDPSCYPEYYAGVTASLFNILKATISTEYKDRIFKHEAVGILNLKIIQINVGISMESGEFLKSFNASGLGFYITSLLGF